MRKITKGIEPTELTKWKKANPNAQYKKTTPDIRTAIRTSCINEQYGLCAYCCKPITPTTSHNEHVEAQRLAPKRTVDYTNIVASCETRDQCGKAHDSQKLSLTPLMEECESEIRYRFSGQAIGLTERAKQCLQVLNLQSRALNEARKRAIEALLFEEGGPPPTEVAELGEEILSILMDAFAPQNGQNLGAYSPILLNILRQEQQNRPSYCE